MTPKQLERLLETGGLSQRAAAKLIGINERTMRKYIAGDSKIPLTVEYALKWITHHINPVQS